MGDVGDVAAIMMLRGGELRTWYSPFWLGVEGGRDALESWVRLQVVRGRHFASLLHDDVALCRLPSARLTVHAPPPQTA